jgi:PEP-CTERM motif-containing protein
MVKRNGKWRWRRALILALFLLIPTLLSDLPVFSRTGHGAAPAAPALPGSALALLPLDRGAIHPAAGRKHWHTAAGTEGGDAGDEDELLQNLVYLTHGDQSGDDNNPLSDGGDGWSFGGGGGHGGGSGGGGSGGGFGGTPFSSPGGNDPATDFLPFDPPGPDANNKGGGDPPFLSSTLPPALPTIAAVPEPATWALFILGFGFIGTLLRRARDAQLAPALTRPRAKRLG